MCKFTIKNRIVIHYLQRFVVVNLKSKMLIIVNTKFRALHFFDFCHFSQILNHWLRRLKIREF